MDEQDIQPDTDANIDLTEIDGPEIHTLPSAIKELRGLRASEKKSLSRYREKIKQLVADLQQEREKAAIVIARIQNIETKAIKSAEDAETAQEETAKAIAKASNLVIEAEGILETAQTLAPKIDEVVAASDKVESLASKSAERSKHIEDGFQYVESTRPKVEKAVVEINDYQSSIKQISSDVSESKGRIETLEESVSALHSTAHDAVGSVEKEIGQFSKRNNELVGQGELLQQYLDQSKSLTEEVESLLPGAASAGLASSFKANADELKWSIRMWEGMSVFALLGLAVYGLVYGIGSLDAVKEMVINSQSDGVVLNTDQILTLLGMILIKGLIAVPIVWLVLFSGYRGSKQKRVREDYRYKAAIAMAFQGFKNQFEDIDSDENSPANGLSQNVLKSLAAEPGRLYDTKYQEVTPVSAAAEAIAKVAKGQKGKFKAAGIEADVDSTHLDED